EVRQLKEVPAEFNRIWASPPPKFKFLRDAEDKLEKRKLIERFGVDGCVQKSDEYNGVKDDENGSFITLVVSKGNEIGHQFPSSSSQPSSLSSTGLTTDTQVHEPQSASWFRPHVQGFDHDINVDNELLRLQGLSGPPRFLFTIKEETKEDMESEDKSKKGSSRGFWKEKETMFPVLSRMAMDLISVQASSVASESAFSTSERALSIRRTRLTPMSLEMCICLKDHLDAKERKQDKCPLEIPLGFEEDVLMTRCNQMKSFHYPMKKLH
nr:zinc finger BED domain-containing protein RICESLEEPER 3 [Tanacetum cinerariifolium]